MKILILFFLLLGVTKSIGSNSRRISTHSAFLAWLEHQNTTMNAIDVFSMGGAELAVHAKTDLKANDVLFYIPESIVMNMKSANDTVLADIFTTYPNISWWDPMNFIGLHLHLIYEYFYKGEKSFYWPYLNTLPTEEELFTMPYYFNKVEYSALQKIKTGSIVTSNTDNAYKTNSKIILPILQSYPSIFGTREVAEFQRMITWSVTIVRSRSYAPRDTKRDYAMLCPLADLMNHRLGRKSLSYTTFTDDAKEKLFYAHQLKYDYKAGDELFASYHVDDSSCNFFLLHNYGFASDEDGSQCGHLVLSSVVSDVKLKLLMNLRREARPGNDDIAIPQHAEDERRYTMEWILHLNDRKRFDELIATTRILIADENICRLVKDVSLQTPFILGHEAEFNAFQLLLKQTKRLQQESIAQRVKLIEEARSSKDFREENFGNIMKLIDGEIRVLASLERYIRNNWRNYLDSDF